MSAQQTIPSRTALPVLVMVDPRADALSTAEWTADLRKTGLDAFTVAIKDAERAAAHGARPVLIASGTATRPAWRLLLEDKASAAVLIGSAITAVAGTRSHGPVLLLDGTGTPTAPGDVLRATGICDQQWVESRRDDLTRGECGENIAYYIRDWLDFHQLTER